MINVKVFKSLNGEVKKVVAYSNGSEVYKSSQWFDLFEELAKLPAYDPSGKNIKYEVYRLN